MVQEDGRGMHNIQEYSGSWQSFLNTPAVVSCLLLRDLSEVPALLLIMTLLPFCWRIKAMHPSILMIAFLSFLQPWGWRGAHVCVRVCVCMFMTISYFALTASCILPWQWWSYLGSSVWYHESISSWSGRGMSHHEWWLPLAFGKRLGIRSMSPFYQS